jgi:glycosyltransferase involved in cell wall biosynthesis
VIPAHNEERFLGGVIRTLPSDIDAILVVDDSSTDRTREVARSVADPRVVVLTTPRNLGVGGATVLGYRKAMDLGAEVIVKMDGDGQMAPEYLSDLLDPIVTDGYQYAKGNRFLAGESLAAMPRHRVFGNVGLTFMTKLASGYWHIFDPLNGYTAISTVALRKIDLDRVHQGYFFESDMLYQLNLHGFRARDVAVPAHYGDEESGLNPFRVGLTFPLLLFQMFFKRIYQKYVLRDFSPVALFLFVGLLLFTWGTAFGAYLWIRSSLTGQPTLTGTIMLAILPLILGFQLLLQAIVLDIQETPR